MSTFCIQALACIRGEQCLFHGLSLNLEAGQLLCISGANGSGKSSLLRLLAGIATPAYGQIIWNNQEISHSLIAYQQAVHFLSHQNGHQLALTAKENLALAANLQIEQPQEPMANSLNYWQLTKLQDKAVRLLSAGQKRRLALARLSLIKKPLWLLDEPVTALDQTTQQLFYAQLVQHLQTGGIAIVSSHHQLPAHLTYQTLTLGKDYV